MGCLPAGVPFALEGEPGMPESSHEDRLALAFVDLADTLVQDFDVINFLHSLTEHCVDLLDVAAAGVLLATPQGQLVDAAASDERTRKLELASTEWDEGPCRDCFRSRAQVAVDRLDDPAVQVRWPYFAPAAVELGFTEGWKQRRTFSAFSCRALAMSMGRDAPVLPRWVSPECRYACRSQPVTVAPPRAVCASSSMRAPVSGHTSRGLTTLPGPACGGR